MLCFERQVAATLAGSPDGALAWARLTGHGRLLRLVKLLP